MCLLGQNLLPWLNWKENDLNVMQLVCIFSPPFWRNSRFVRLSGPLVCPEPKLSRQPITFCLFSPSNLLALNVMLIWVIIVSIPVWVFLLDLMCYPNALRCPPIPTLLMRCICYVFRRPSLNRHLNSASTTAVLSIWTSIPFLIMGKSPYWRNIGLGPEEKG